MDEHPYMFLQGGYNAISVSKLQGLPTKTKATDVLRDAHSFKPFPTHFLFNTSAFLPPEAYSLDVTDLSGNLTSTFAHREGPSEGPQYTYLQVSREFDVRN